MFDTFASLADLPPFDVIILGGGMHGAILAEQLSSGGRGRGPRVLVLEGGPFLLGGHAKNAGRVDAGIWQSRRRTPWLSRGRINFHPLTPAIGGRSLCWSAWSPRPVAGEIEDWPEAVKRDLTERYFAQAERYLRVHGSGSLQSPGLHAELRNKLPAALPASGLPHLFESRDAPLALWREGKRLRTFSSVPRLRRAYGHAKRRAPAAAHRRLVIVPNCRVLRLGTKGNLVNWVHTESGRIPVGPTSTVVIALGAIESTRLALASFAHLDALGLTGRNLMGHLHSGVTVRIPVAKFLRRSPKQVEVAGLWLKGRVKGRYFHLQGLVAAIPAGASLNDERIRAALFAQVPGLSGAEMFPGLDSTHCVVTVQSLGEMAPSRRRARSQVRLQGGGKTGAKDLAVVRVTLAAEDKALWRAMDVASDHLLRRLAAGRTPEYLFAGPRWARVAPSASGRRFPNLLHEAGPLWFGTDPTNSVTNADARFHAVENAYAIGEALFPSCGSFNPSLTTAALVLRLANHLRHHGRPGEIAKARRKRSMIPLSVIRADNRETGISMKTKSSPKKQSIALKDLQTKKNPKGGVSIPVGASLGTKTTTNVLTISGRSS